MGQTISLETLAAGTSVSLGHGAATQISLVTSLPSLKGMFFGLFQLLSGFSGNYVKTKQGFSAC